MNAKSTSMVTETVMIRDLPVNVRRGGAGEPLLILHAMGGAPQPSPFLDLLSAQYELIIPDHPGFGQSGTPDWLHCVGDLAFHYLDFLEALNLLGTRVVGISLGGWIAGEIAIRNPAAFRAISLLAPAGLCADPSGVANVFEMNPPELIRSLYFDQSIADRQLGVPPPPALAEAMSRNRGTSRKVASDPLLFSPELERWIHRIQTPTQIIWGRQDKLISSLYAEVWQAALPHAELELLESCGHLPNVERPDRTAQLILDFTSRH